MQDIYNESEAAVAAWEAAKIGETEGSFHISRVFYAAAATRNDNPEVSCQGILEFEKYYSYITKARLIIPFAEYSVSLREDIHKQIEQASRQIAKNNQQHFIVNDVVPSSGLLRVKEAFGLPIGNHESTGPGVQTGTILGMITSEDQGDFSIRTSHGDRIAILYEFPHADMMTRANPIKAVALLDQEMRKGLGLLLQPLPFTNFANS